MSLHHKRRLGIANAAQRSPELRHVAADNVWHGHHGVTGNEHALAMTKPPTRSSVWPGRCISSSTLIAQMQVQLVIEHHVRQAQFSVDQRRTLLSGARQAGRPQAGQELAAAGVGDYQRLLKEIGARDVIGVMVSQHQVADRARPRLGVAEVNDLARLDGKRQRIHHHDALRKVSTAIAVA